MDGKEAVLKKLAEATDFVRAKGEEFRAAQERGEARDAENKETLEKFEATILGLQEQVKALRQPYPDGAPLSADPDSDDRMFSNGILHGAAGPVNFQRMMDTSPNHPYVKGTRDEGSMKYVQNLTDAAVIRYNLLRNKNDQAVSIEIMAKHPETREWAQALKRFGYIKDVEAFLNPASGQLLKIAMTKPSEERANELIYPGNSTQGFDNLTFTQVSAQLLDQIYVNLTVAQNVGKMTLPRPSYKMPRLTGLTQGVWGGSSSTGSGNIEIPSQSYTGASGLMPDASFFQKPTIAYTQFDVEHMLSFLLLNDDASEDLIVPMIPFLRNELAKNMARAWDDAILNGHSLDTANQMDQLQDTNHARLAVDGIRYRTIGHQQIQTTPDYTLEAGVDAGGDGLAVNPDLETAIKMGGKYWTNPSNAVFTFTIPQYYRMVQSSAFQKVTDIGNFATYLRGTLGAIYGYAINVSDVIPTTLSTKGVHATIDGTGANKACAFLWRPDQFVWGTFGGTTMESTRWAPKLFTILQADNRGDFQSIPAATFTNDDGPWPGVCIYNTVD